MSRVGHTFPKHYTQWPDGTEGFASHQRIISYNFAGLQCLVRFDADGYSSTSWEKEEKEKLRATGRNEADKKAQI